MRLARLPDRTPVKLAVAVSPMLHERLKSYAALYRETYRTEERIEELVPFMLEAFLDADREFARTRKRKAAQPKEK
jgi:hypothetical protein